MKAGQSLVFGSALLLSIVAGAPEGQSQVYEGKQLVKASLVAEADTVVPGKRITVGLLLRIAPHWHTYWKFSGDAGLPTEIKWNLPTGWKVGEIQWPIPLKLKEPGDILTYGYSDEVLLIQQITPPDKIDSSEVKLAAEANWLVCEKLCIPGSAKLGITLPKATSSSPANVELFTRYRALLPGGALARDVGIKQWSRSPSEVSFTVHAAGLAKHEFVDLYPLPDEKAVIGHPQVTSRSDDDVTFKIPFETVPPNHFRGLVVAGQADSGPNRIGSYFDAGTREEIQAAQPSAPMASTRGLATYLLFGFIGGFILNLMPCVLPVISLKIFGFVKQAGQDRRRIFESGLAFVAGIFAWFVGLALVLVGFKIAGHELTWAVQFTNPYFVLGMSVVVLVFALDLFGVFEIVLPQWATRAMLTPAERKDHVGSFFQGVFATMLATPCTAPFLGTALGFAFTQSPIVIISMFIAIAAGMAAPYLLLSAQPAWLRFLPKPGPWMLHVKQFMGFLLLATLLFLLYVIGAQRGYEALVWASSFLLMIAIACWMKGAFALPTASLAKRAVVLVLMLLLVLVSGLYFIGDKFRSAKIEIGQTQPDGDWQAFTLDRLQTELGQGRAVFVDFTAAWCITCKFNEKAVLESGAVREAFQRHGIVKLKADWTNGDPVITKLLQQFGRPGVPLYVLYPGKTAEPVVFPELITKSMILDKLETISSNVALH